MPWMPEVFAAPVAEALGGRDATRANDAVPYYEGIMADEPDALARSFAAKQPVLDDPRVGHVEGTAGLRAFVADQASWLRERDAVVENVALTPTPTRTVEEVVLHAVADGGGRVELPVAVVADRTPDRTLKAVRVYHSMWPLTGRHTVRPPLLPEDPSLHAEGAPGDYQRALAEGDLAGGRRGDLRARRIRARAERRGVPPSGRRGAAGVLRAPVRQRRRHPAGALHPYRRRRTVRHRVRLRALGDYRHSAPGGGGGLRAR